MNRTRLNIGTYILAPYARSEEHIRELRGCGIDFVVCMGYDREALDLFQGYGIGAIVSGVLPGWWGGDGNNAGKMAAANPMEKYIDAARKFTDHPAIWGIDTGDEPSALDFPHYGKVINYVDRAFPEQFAYLNLYPNYASVSKNNAEETVNQLGTPTYAEHIRKYCENVGTDYICYDYYMYAASVAGAYENLCTVSDACRSTGRSLWIVLQVNSSRESEWISEAQLRHQAYSALAFGAENIIWACYTAGWWFNNVLDKNGDKTQQYDKLKAVNAELAYLGKEYMKYRCVSTHFIGFDAPGKLGENITSVASLSTGIFSEVCGKDIAAGQMVSRSCDSSYALMLCAAGDPSGKTGEESEITFYAYGRKVRAFGAAGESVLSPDENGKFSVSVKNCGGVLITAE